MPIWMRKHHIMLINENFKEQEKAMKKSQNRSQSSGVSRPNIKPSTTYNI